MRLLLCMKEYLFNKTLFLNTKNAEEQIIGAPILNVLSANLWVTGKDTHVCLMYPQASIFCNFFTYIFKTGVKQSLWNLKWKNYKISFCYCETMEVHMLKGFILFMWLFWTHAHRKFLVTIERFVFTILRQNEYQFWHIL